MFDTTLPPHCTPTSPFLENISRTFGTCIPTELAFISILLGSLSILSWLFAQMPQIYKNYQIQSTQGLSVYFLVEWLLGDLTNLLGGIFTKQAGWQVIIASYYVFVDLCLVCQYFWYSHFKPIIVGTSLHSRGSSEHSDTDSDIINGLSPINTTFLADGAANPEHQSGNSNGSRQSKPIDTPQFGPVNYEKKKSVFGSLRYNDKSGSSWMAAASPRTVMYTATMASLASQAAAAPVSMTTQQMPNEFYLFQAKSAIEVAGTILSWSSTILYLGSRLPQLYKNWKRKSTAGLSPLLFFAAFCGNFFYSSSMLTNPNAWYDFDSYGGHGWADGEGSQRIAWIVNAAPFFLGAAGVLGMDATMGLQFMLYSEREEEMVKVRDGRGHSRWQRVSGWMRGWVPFSPKARVVDLAESERLLARSRDLDRIERSYGGINS